MHIRFFAVTDVTCSGLWSLKPGWVAQWCLNHMNDRDKEASLHNNYIAGYYTSILGVR